MHSLKLKLTMEKRARWHNCHWEWWWELRMFNDSWHWTLKNLEKASNWWQHLLRWVRGLRGDDAAHKFLFLQEWSIVQQCQPTYHYNCLPNYLEPPHSRCHFGAIEHNPLVFSKSLAVQVRSLIIVPLQPLEEAADYFLSLAVSTNVLNPKFGEIF